MYGLPTENGRSGDDSALAALDSITAGSRYPDPAGYGATGDSSYGFDDGYVQMALEGSAGPWGYGPFGADPAALPQRGRTYLFLLSFCWGLLTTFAVLFWQAITGGGGDASSLWGGWVQAFALGMAVAGLVVYARGLGPLLAPILDPAGLLMIFHMLAALVSAIVASANPILAARYVMLTVAFGTFIYLRNMGASAVTAVRAGLTGAGTMMALYNATFITSGHFTDPFFRINNFQNASIIGFIVSMTAISLLEFALSGLRGGRKLRWSFSLFGLFATCVLVVYFTRSRTAALTTAAGVMVLLALRTRPWVGLTLFLVFVPVAVVFQQNLFGIGETLFDVYRMNDRYRDVSTLTGRTDIWRDLFYNVFLPNPLFGGGPGALASRAPAHNAILYNLAELGVLGTAPLVLILLMALLSSWVNRRDAGLHWAIAILVAGLIESVAESQLFAFGSPASLLFLAAVTTLTGALFKRRQPGPAEVPAEGYGEPVPNEGYG